jgi:hypothetical protein
MIARELRDRLKSLTDDLLEQADDDAAWLASVLLAVQDAVDNGAIAGLALRVWRTNQAAPEPSAEMVCARDATNHQNRVRCGGASRRTPNRAAGPASRPGSGMGARERPRR